MTIAGWIVMLFSVIGMTGLLAWCIYKVFSTPESTEHLHTQVDIHLPDTDDQED